MRFSVPAIWDFNGAEKLKGYADEFYGKLASDFVGGGRSSAFLPHVKRKEVEEYIGFFRKLGIEFNYLLNGACLDNLEFTDKGQRELRLLLDWVEKMEVDSVTVSIPYLLEIIKKKYPRLKACISTYAGIDSIEKAQFWESLGADRITLYSAGITRNFKLLKKIREHVKCNIQLFANNSCLYECPLTNYHSLILTHSSQRNHASGGFMVDYCRLTCMYKRLLDPTGFIRSEWIRPEDLHYYEELGIDGIKVLDRMRVPEDTVSIVKAYAGRRYDGNLMDLLFARKGGNIWQKSKIFVGLRYFLRPFAVNIFRLRKTADLDLALSEHVYIDNRSLDGFLEHFLNHDCSLTRCKDCNYCRKTADDTVKIDRDWQKESIVKYAGALRSMIDGDLFRYSGK